MMQRFLEALKQHELLLSTKGLDINIPLPRPRYDHRKVESGDAFIAIKGTSFDGHNVIQEALARGASLIVSENDAGNIQVKDSRKAAALFADEFYEHPANKFTLYGITGTNGKTTVSLMLYQLLRLSGRSCGWIGTLGYKINDQHFDTMHTTPDILELREIFNQMAQQGVQDVVMEVSSHALALDRVYNVFYDYCLFTNLSRDHLDFHKDMEQYFAAKYKLFERAIHSSAISVVNIDDEHGEEIAERLKTQGAKVYSVGSTETADFRILNPQTRLNGSAFDLKLAGAGCHPVQSPLIGSFNVENLALALATLATGTSDLPGLFSLVPKLQPVPGRIEAVTNDRGIGVYVDYAHSPDAIMNLLKSVEKLPHKRIITIIGAGGDRDKGKRPLMLQAALRYSNAVIVSDDNPRTENPNLIICDIVQDRDLALPWWIIRDRKEAIGAAIRMAGPKDIVLICGKGHETYQEVDGIRFDFDDRAIARKFLSLDSKAKSDDELILPIDPLMLKILSDDEITEDEDRRATSFQYLSTDSRNIKAKSLFFALKGERYDANQFIPTILSTQDCWAVGSTSGIIHDHYLYSSDPVRLMAAVLQKYLQMFDVYKIAITGSTGKTSTKEMLASILQSHAPTLKTQKNENNIIGLCRTILRIEPKHRYAVFEIGTNRFGEIAHLADTIRPDAGIIINIGPSHLEYFGDEEGVFREKSDLFHRALDLRLFPADDPRFEIYHESGKSVGYHETAEYRIEDIQESNLGLSFCLCQQRYYLPYRIQHYVINSAFCIAMALHLGLSKENIHEALAKPIIADMRMQIEACPHGWLIVDCYNANPVSMQAALEFWRDYHPELPHLAILGDMLELGETAGMYHNMVGAMLAEIPHQGLYTVGNYARAYHQDVSRHYSTVDELLQQLPEFPKQSVILIKASHGIHLEKLLPKLRGVN